MSALVFVDLPRRKAGNPALLAEALGIDPYRARMVVSEGAPFVFRSGSLEAAAAAARRLTEGGMPSSAHAKERVDAVPPPREAHTFSRETAGVVFHGANGPVATVGEGAALCFAIGKITRIPDATPGTRKMTLSLEVFAGSAGEGKVVRIGVRQDRFDFSPLGPKKDLASTRNLHVLREVLAVDAPHDDSFHRTEMSRNELLNDVWEEVDPLRGSVVKIPVRSNRLAFDRYARLWFLHVTSRVPRSAAGKEVHWLEL